MTVFPFFMDITGKRFLVIGGGRVAADKVARLRRFTSAITVVAPVTEIGCDEDAVDGAGELLVLRKEYEESDLDGADYVVAATGDRDLDHRIARDCRAQGIPINVVDDAAYCDFIFPAVIKRGPLTVAVSTSGTSPAYAQMLRREIERLIPENIEEILDRMGEIRSEVMETEPDQRKRAAIYRRILAEMLESSGTVGAESSETVGAESFETAGVEPRGEVPEKRE